MIDSQRHLLESKRRSFARATVPDAIGFRGHLSLKAELPREMALIAKAMAKSDFTQAPLGKDKVLTGEADTNSAQVLLGSEAKLPHKKPFKRTHGTAGNCGKGLVGNGGCVVFSHKCQGAAQT